MASPIGSLLWKEWREQRWKLGYGCGTLGAFTAIGLRARLLPDLGIVFLSGALGAGIMSALVAMGLVAAERDEGSLECLLALPVRPAVVLITKLAVGAAACLAPLAVAAAVACLMAGGREMTTGRILLAYFGCGEFALCALVWFTAFGLRQPTEAQAVLVAIIVFGVWYAIHIVFTELPYGWDEPGALTGMAHPFGFSVFLTSPDRSYSAGHAAALLAVQAAEAGLLLLWALARFGRPGRATT